MPSIDARTLAEAYRIASRVLSIALGCVIPVSLGYFVDRWLSISPAGVVAGSLVGFASMTLQIRKLAAELSAKRPQP